MRSNTLTRVSNNPGAVHLATKKVDRPLIIRAQMAEILIRIAFPAALIGIGITEKVMS